MNQLAKPHWQILPFAFVETINTCNQQQSIYIKYHNTIHTVLKNQILNAVDEKYISKLKYDRTKYATVIPSALLTHFWETYAKIDLSHQTANKLCMRAQ